MELVLTRTFKGKDYTIGRLTIDGEDFCDTLEPTWRNIGLGRTGRKIKGRTAIPEGRYPVVITRSPKFGEWLPLLLHVPMFEGIRIHAGNTVDDTEGCILVGHHMRRGMVLESRASLIRLKEQIVRAKKKGEGVWIVIQ